MTKIKRIPVLSVAGRAGAATVRAIAPIVATAAAAGALAGVVAIPVDRYLKGKERMY